MRAAGGEAGKRAAGRGLPEVLRLFTFTCYATPPVLGSVVSFAWHGGALWCLGAILWGRYKLSNDRPMWLLALLLYTYVAASLVSFLLNEPRWSDTPELIPLVTFLLFPFSYSIWRLADRQTIAVSAALGSMVASYGALLLAIVQHFVMEIRPEGGAGNPLIFATVACIAGTISLAAALTLKPRWAFLLAGGYFAAIAAVMLSGSRSVWLVMALITGAILIVCRRQIREIGRRHLLAVGAVLAVAIVVSLGTVSMRVANLADDWSKLTEVGKYNTSLGFRVALLEIGAERIAEHPLTGNGLQHTSRIIVEGLADKFHIDAGFSHFHNGFITLLVESGMVGAGAILALYLVSAWMAVSALRTSDDPHARFGVFILVVFLVNYVVGGNFNIMLGHDIVDTMFMILLICGTILTLRSLDETVGNGVDDMSFSTITPAEKVPPPRQAHR